MRKNDEQKTNKLKKEKVKKEKTKKIPKRDNTIKMMMFNRKEGLK